MTQSHVPEPPSEEMAASGRVHAGQHAGENDDGAWDRHGCFWTMLRFGCGSAILWILMTIGIIGAALLSLTLFR